MQKTGMPRSCWWRRQAAAQRPLPLKISKAAPRGAAMAWATIPLKGSATRALERQLPGASGPPGVTAAPAPRARPWRTGVRSGRSANGRRPWPRANCGGPTARRGWRPRVEAGTTSVAAPPGGGKPELHAGKPGSTP
eukprot:5940149-Lingulodinium_polyedra.AAC.1